VRYTIRHTFNIDADTFWNKLFFDPAYNQALFEGHLKFNVYRVLKLEHGGDGSVHRRVESAPPIEVPAVVKKIVGENTSYIEDGRFDPKTQRFRIEVMPKVGADKIKTVLTLSVEPRGPKKIERIAEIDTTVNVFGVGKVIELFVEKQMRATYDAASDFTQQWIAQKGL
jgi:hypothetical protein